MKRLATALLLIASAAQAGMDPVATGETAGGNGSGRGLAGHLITGAVIGALLGFAYATLRGKPETVCAGMGAAWGAALMGVLGW